MKISYAMVGLAGICILAATVLADYSKMIRVESRDERRASAVVGRAERVELSERLSDAPCVRGRTWGFENEKIWVDDGCRAVFRVFYRGNNNNNGGNNNNNNNNGNWNGGNNNNNNGNWNGGGGGSQVDRVTLSSNGSRVFRVINERSSVRLIRQISSTPCKNGYSWGVLDRKRLYVDHGCRAEFEIRY